MLRVEHVDMQLQLIAAWVGRSVQLVVRHAIYAAAVEWDNWAVVDAPTALPSP